MLTSLENGFMGINFGNADAVNTTIKRLSKYAFKVSLPKEAPAPSFKFSKLVFAKIVRTG